MDTTLKIGIIGGGVEGTALIKYLQSKGYKNLCLFDEREVLEEELPADIVKILGTGAFDKVDDCDLLFRSPGVHPSKLERARQLHIPITSTTQYFLEHCPCPVIGVTGTKGKGTTSTLIYLMLKEAGYDVYLGGNIGESPLNFLDALKPSSRVVLELSSFQLQDVTISPHVAVVVMTTSEHLDYHKDRGEYWEAKMPILRFQKAEDMTVLNQDYEYAAVFAAVGEGQKFFVSRAGIVKQGAYLKDGLFYWNSHEKANSQSESQNRSLVLGEAHKVALLGQHNLENVLAALAAGQLLGLSPDVMQKVIYNFKGLPHRLEFVSEKNGVRYYNDSFSTTPETSIAASYAFSGPVILLAGGSEKNSDYTEWAEALSANKNLKAVILMGVTADRMGKLLAEKGVERQVVRVQSLQEALNRAAQLGQPGDNVVLSPAAASFDMFKNYKDRGERFREMVEAIKSYN